ncbi:MAG: hypothetical protein K0Q96_333 [Rubrobacteraceae bacterium]|jgi:hypothetical protein|nr:hypothetical protein [Rubrobacteraceae bacterium]
MTLACRSLYSASCVEGAFCEVHMQGVHRSPSERREEGF